MKEKLEEIEKKLDVLITKINSIEDWKDNLNEDFLWDFTDFDQSEMFSWFHLAESVEGMESILFALDEKFNLNTDEVDVEWHKIHKGQQIKIEKLEKKIKEFSRASNINLKVKEDTTQSETWQDALYKLAHSINNDLHSAGHLLASKQEDPEITNAYYHIKRIDDLVKLNLWLLKKNELKEEWSTLDVGNEILELIISTKRGILTLRTSTPHQEKLINLNITPQISGDVCIEIGNEKLDSIISLILQDLVRNSFKYSDEFNPQINVSVDGTASNCVIVMFSNNKKMDDKFIRYINYRDVEPNISDSSKVGLRSIMEWVTMLKDFGIQCWNSENKNECTIKLVIPRSVTL